MGKGTIQSVQKACATFVKFVHTFEWENGTIINVKTPQYIIYIVFTTPHSKNTFSLKGQPIGGCLFLLYRKLLSCKVKNAPRGCALRRIR